MTYQLTKTIALTFRNLILADFSVSTTGYERISDKSYTTESSKRMLWLHNWNSMTKKKIKNLTIQFGSKISHFFFLPINYVCCCQLNSLVGVAHAIINIDLWITSRCNKELRYIVWWAWCWHTKSPMNGRCIQNLFVSK